MRILRINSYLFGICLIFAASCKKDSMDKEIMPPKAEKIARNLEIHGHTRVDNYYWLNERENPKVIDYLKAENDYYFQKTAHTKVFQDKLFQELKPFSVQNCLIL